MQEVSFRGFRGKLKNEIAMIYQSPTEMIITLMAIGFADLRFHLAIKKQIINR